MNELNFMIQTLLSQNSNKSKEILSKLITLKERYLHEQPPKLNDLSLTLKTLK